jgi:hypothetical protein
MAWAIRSAASLWLMLALVAPPALAFDIEGFEVDEAAVVDGQKLVLNGAGWRKRGYSKIDVTALYVEQRQSTADALIKHAGRKRILLRPLRDRRVLLACGA